MDEPKYKRVLLKISGEALAGDKHFGLDFQVMGRVADVIKECVAMGVQVGVVIGGGNFWRGVKNGEGHIERTRADHMGMLATAMNCMAMADVLEVEDENAKVRARIAAGEVNAETGEELQEATYTQLLMGITKAWTPGSRRRGRSRRWRSPTSGPGPCAIWKRAAW